MLGMVNTMKQFIASMFSLYMLREIKQTVMIDTIGRNSETEYTNLPRSRPDSSLHLPWYSSGKYFWACEEIFVHIFKQRKNLSIRENKTTTLTKRRSTGGFDMGIHFTLFERQKLQNTMLSRSLCECISWTNEAVHSGVTTRFTRRMAFVSVLSLILPRKS